MSMKAQVKAQVSRLTHDRDRRFNAVLLPQARMITDADWNEASLVARDAVVTALEATAGSGVPAEGGVVRDLSAAGVGTLAWGAAVVDGIACVVAPAGGDPTTAFDIGAQADLVAAAGADLVAGRAVYLDVWERTVTSIEDPGLADPAWNGADTAFRGKVMAQVKQSGFDADGAPLAADPAQNPRIGNARLSATLRDTVDSPDPCDPCAGDLKLPGRVGNHLFRLEVHDVTAPADPTAITLAWSTENAGEQHRADAPLPNDFVAGDHHYEFHDLRTEQALGVVLDTPAGWRLDASPIQDSVTPAPANPVANAAWTGIRRWDGWCRLTRANGAWTVAEGRELGQDLAATATVAGGVLTLPLTSLEVKLDLSGGADGLKVLRGDFWLVEIRGDEPAPGANKPDPRCRVISETPVGIHHHYLPLGRWEADGLHVDGDPARRALSFPPVTAIGADHVGYAAQACGSGLFGPAEDTVQRALDRLCTLDAGNVAYRGDCTTVAASTTVREAIDALCAALGRRADDCRPRLALFGRGVICGVVPTATIGDPKGDVLDAVLGIVATQPDGTMLSDDDFLRRRPPAPSEERAKLFQRLRTVGDALGSDDVRAAIREVEPELQGDALDRKLSDVIERLRPQREGTGEFVTVRFATGAGTAVDGNGCYHDIPALEAVGVVNSWDVVFGFAPQEAGRFAQALRVAADQGFADADVPDDLRAVDLSNRLDAVVKATVEGGSVDATALRKRLVDLGDWKSDVILKKVGDLAVEHAGFRRVPKEAIGWLYLVFDDVGRPALQFRTDPPAPWLHPPKMLMPANTGVVGPQRDLHALTDAAIDAIAAVAPQGTVRPDTHAVLAAATDDQGVLRVGRLREALVGSFAGVRPGAGVPIHAIDSSLATVLGGVEAMRPVAASGTATAITAEAAAAATAAAATGEVGAVATPAEQPPFVMTTIPGMTPITIGSVIDLAGGPVAVTPIGTDIVAIGDPPLDISGRLAAIWSPYQDLACPQPNDGSVCLAKVGVYGDEVVIVPDDREQIVTSPANLNAVDNATRRPRVFDAVFEAIKG